MSMHVQALQFHQHYVMSPKLYQETGEYISTIPSSPFMFLSVFWT